MQLEVNMVEGNYNTGLYIFVDLILVEAYIFSIFCECLKCQFYLDMILVDNGVS